MALQTATANLSSQFRFIPATGLIKYEQGFLDTDNTIKALGANSRWGELSNWSLFTSYSSGTQEIRWTAPLLDIGQLTYFTLDILTSTDGECYFRIYVSETGEFRGEELEYLVQNGNTSVESFYGRYVYVTAFSTGKVLSQLSIKSNTDTIDYEINNVSTSTLSGTSSERTIVLPRAVSKITDIFISPKAPTAYAVNLYVSDSATSQVLIPVVKNKSATSPTFALYGIDNDPRDGIVDIRIKALPRMVMYGGRLTVIQ